MVPHAGVVVHHVAAAHVLGAGPDELSEVPDPQVGAACPLGGVHAWLQSGPPHLVIPLKARLPPVRGHLDCQGVVVKCASLKQILPNSEPRLGEFTEVFTDYCEPADVIGVMVPLALVGPQLGTVGKLFIPPDYYTFYGSDFIDDGDVT